MHVLVIGGNRFVGWLLGFRLLAGGHRLTLLNRGSLPDPFGGRAERLVGDRRRDLQRLVAGRTFDAVVDLAAYTGEDGRRAAEVFQGRVGHHVMISTGQVYLVRDGCPRPASERDYEGPLLPRPAEPNELEEWTYGVDKRACEDALAEAHARHGFPATRLRLPMVNGERDFHRRMEGYLWRLLDGGPVLLPDGGTHAVRHVYGGEVARFIVEILLRADTFGHAYNVAQHETPTLAGMIGRLRDLLGSRSPLVPVARERLVAAGLRPAAVSPFSGAWMSFLDPRRVEHELGFRHEPLELYLGKIVAAFLAHPPPDRPPALAGRALELEVASRA